MKKFLNNKGYMLVEIILASVIAMGVGFFITELTIKLKNKNDDLIVKTQVHTDQSIIYNTIMKDIYDEPDKFDCKYVESIGTTGSNKFEYRDFVTYLSEYTKIDPNYITCQKGDEGITIKIPISVPQLNENFDVEIRTLATS